MALSERDMGTFRKTHMITVCLCTVLALMRIIPCLGLDRLSNHPKRSSFLRLQSIYLPALPSIEDKGKKPSWLQIEHKSLMLMFGLLTNRKAEGVLTY